MKKGRIIILSGPSGSGKTTLHKMLLQSRLLKGSLVKSISATTRPPRSQEKNGVDYLFISPRQFKDRRRRGYFLEWQKVFVHYYGTPIGFVKKLLSSGKNVLLCIDVKGAKVISRKFPEALKIFISVPSLKILKERLKSRGTEDPKELRHRLETARKEMREAKHYDHMVVNDRLLSAFRKLEIIVTKELFPSRN